MKNNHVAILVTNFIENERKVKVKNIVEVRLKGGGVVCKMPLWVWRLTGRKPFNKLGGFIIMEYQCDPECKKGGLWHLLSAFRAWFKYSRVRG